jgi:uncharacterized membrane-anchored protein
MAKSASPIRLENSLMKEAKTAASLNHRTTTEQIEYWADIGQRVAKVITPDALIRIQSGLTKIRLDPVNTHRVDPETLFNSLAEKQKSGELAQDITQAKFRYQASTQYPGLLEQIDKQGRSRLGRFSDGVFTPVVEQNIDG